VVDSTRLLLAWCLMAPAVPGCGRSHGDTRPAKPNEAPMTDRQPRIEVYGPLPAEGPVRLDVVDVDWSAGGAVLNVPGPRRKPVRPYLEPFPTATQAVGARAVRGDGQVAPAAVVARGGLSVIPLPAPPLAVAPRSDGAWALFRSHLAHHDASGAEVRKVPLTGVILVAGPDDAVWVVGLETAHHVAADGAVHGPYAWRGDVHSVASGGRLCTSKGAAPGTMACLDPAGAENTQPVPSAPRLNIQGAGLAPGGHGFVSTLDQAGVQLSVDGAAARRLPLPPGVPAQGPFGVAAVEEQRSLAMGLEHGAWYKGDQVDRAFAIDEAVYRNELFPHAWRLAPTRLVGLSDGSLVVSASGPAGMVLLKVPAP
jgi:hypothetical protein